MDRGAQVVVVSASSNRDSAALRAAANVAAAWNVVVVAGVEDEDDNDGERAFPAAYASVLSVDAVAEGGDRKLGERASSALVAAPGKEVLSIGPRGGQFVSSGTEVAAAFVGGAAALVRAYHPQLSATAVGSRLIATADPEPGGRVVVDPYSAVAAVLPNESGATLQPAPLAVGALPGKDEGSKGARDAVLLAMLLMAGVLVTVISMPHVVRAGRRRRWLPSGSGVRRSPSAARGRARH